MLSPDEQEIISFLRPLKKQFATSREICRRACGKQRFNEDPNWAKPLLKKLEKQGYLESNANGHYRIKPEEDAKGKVPLAPHIQKILSQSSKDFSTSIIINVDEDYENLTKKPGKPKGDREP